MNSPRLARIERSVGRPTPGGLARAWLTVGTQSVGGGTSTLYMIRRELVERRAWLTQREFLEDWVLCKMSLGISLIALTGLVGSRVLGARGMVVSVLAMLLPAGAITAAMTAGYGIVSEEPLVRAALAGAGPVTAGMTIGMAYVFARQAVRRGWHGAVDWAYAATAVAVGILLALPPALVILVGIAVGALALRGEPRRARADPGS